MQIYTKFRGILRNSVICYTNFFNDTAQTTFSTLSRETSRRWLGVGLGTTVHPSTPTPSLLPVGCLRRFVYLKFRMFRMFFCFVYHSKIYFSDPDSNFNKYLCKITIFPVFWRLNCELCNVLITIPIVPFLSFCLLLFLYSINMKYSPRFQRHLLLVKFLFEGIQNFVWKSCQIIQNVV
jgi:hypothetical protein